MNHYSVQDRFFHNVLSLKSTALANSFYDFQNLFLMGLKQQSFTV